MQTSEQKNITPRRAGGNTWLESSSAPELPTASAEALPAAPAPTEPQYDGSSLDLGYAVHVMLQHAA